MTSHTFTERGVFQKSAAAKAEELKTLVEAGASIEGAAEVAKYTPSQIEAMVNLSIATFEER